MRDAARVNPIAAGPAHMPPKIATSRSTADARRPAGWPRYQLGRVRSIPAGAVGHDGQVEAGAECVCDHLQRPDHSPRKLTDDEARFTVFIGHPSLTAYR
jgi:hypothetical protein